MTKPQFEPPVEPKRVSSPMTSALVAVGLLLIAGVCVLVVVIVVQKTATKVAPAVKEDWQYLGDVRSRDADIVEAQRAAGEAYLPRIALDLTAKPSELTSEGYDVTLQGTIANRGAQDVLKATATITFPAGEGEAPADRREVVLFDATELSPTDDKALAPEETREVSFSLQHVNSRWDTRFVSAAVTEARVPVPEPPEPVESTATE